MNAAETPDPSAAAPAVGTSASPAIHLGFLDGLRTVAALAVVCHHAWLQVWPIEQQRLPTGRTLDLTGWLLYGHFAVGLFIVLSGYCLMLPVVRGDGRLRGGALTFYKKRARRILPPYYCAMALSLLLIALLIGHKTGTHWDICLPVTAESVISHLLLLQDVFGSPSPNHVFWSIAVEWQIYFLFPLLVLAWKRLGPVGTTAGVVLVSWSVFVLLSQSPLLSISPQYLALFALGMLAAGISFSHDPLLLALRRRLPWAVLAGGQFLLLLVICHRRHWLGSFTRLLDLDFLVGFAALCLLVAAARPGPNRLRDFLSWKPFVSTGTFAYSIYLIHAPLLQIVWQYALHPLHLSAGKTFLLLVLVSVPLILGASYLFFLVCERPFLNTRRRETGAESARDAALSPAP